MSYRAYIKTTQYTPFGAIVEFVECAYKYECINKLMEIFSCTRSEAKKLVGEWVKLG